jgi:hypothetical protein
MLLCLVGPGGNFGAVARKRLLSALNADPNPGPQGCACPSVPTFSKAAFRGDVNVAIPRLRHTWSGRLSAAALIAMPDIVLGQRDEGAITGTFTDPRETTETL